MRKLSRQLLKKSKDALLLALEVYNKPTVNYRPEAFSILFINAWELLLKAYLIEKKRDNKAICGKEKGKTISFTQALSKVITDEKDPIRLNLKEIDDLRNQSSHLIIQEYDDLYVGLFQQGIFNYNEQLYAWFQDSINIEPRLLILTFNYKVDSIKQLTLKGKYNKEIISTFETKRKNIMQRLEKNPDMFTN